MWNTQEEYLGILWEVLSSQSKPVSGEDLKKLTGLSIGNVYSGLGKMAEVDLLSLADRKNNLWESHKKIDALVWARAVEIGIPLIALEKTVGLSQKDRKIAEKAIISGQIDFEREERTVAKKKEREKVLRGRAASRAATTDLAKIVQDTHAALQAGENNVVGREIIEGAQKALEALVKALEKN